MRQTLIPSTDTLLTPVGHEAMIPYGHALRSYNSGEKTTKFIIRRDDGHQESIPASHFFRDPEEFTAVECTALEHCQGRILDIGAGTGLHSLFLQSNGFKVTAIEVNDEAVEVMRERGVRNVRRANVFQFNRGSFDTLLMLGRGIGIVEDLTGLDRFLFAAHQLTRNHGQLLIHSLDVRRTDDPQHLEYHESNRAAGRYFGEVRLQFEFEGKCGPYCGWLHVDPQTLTKHAGQTGWITEIILELDTGEYLARLT